MGKIFLEFSSTNSSWEFGKSEDKIKMRSVGCFVAKSCTERWFQYWRKFRFWTFENEFKTIFNLKRPQLLHACLIKIESKHTSIAENLDCSMYSVFWDGWSSIVWHGSICWFTKVRISRSRLKRKRQTDL